MLCTNLVYRISQQQNTHSSQLHTEWCISSKINKERKRKDISKSVKPPATLIRKKRVQTPITNIRNERGSITGSTAVKRMITEHDNQLCANKFNNFQEIDKFLERHYESSLKKKQII